MDIETNTAGKREFVSWFKLMLFDVLIAPINAIV
jgi:hypothetical protein